MRGNGRVICSRLMLFAVLMLFWIVVTASVEPADLVAGAVCSALAVLFYFRLIGREAGTPRRLPFMAIPRFPFFFLALVLEIARANLEVANTILKPSLPIDPRVVEYRTYLPGGAARTMLAGVFTLTPGTVTLQMEGDTYHVHCLGPRYERRLREGGLERLVAWLFGEERHA